MSIDFMPKTCNYKEFFERAFYKRVDYVTEMTYLLQKFYPQIMDPDKLEEVDKLYPSYAGILMRNVEELALTSKHDEEFSSEERDDEALDTESKRIQGTLDKIRLVNGRTVDMRMLKIAKEEGHLDILFIPILLLDYYDITNDLLNQIAKFKPTACNIPDDASIYDTTKKMSEIRALLEYVFSKMVY